MKINRKVLEILAVILRIVCYDVTCLLVHKLSSQANIFSLTRNVW